MLSMYCTASMLPCGRYYYAPEGGYVGNPWVKFSYQYCYLYLGWIVHHLDVIEHYCFRYSRHIKNHSRDLNKKFYRKLNHESMASLPDQYVSKRSTLLFGQKSPNYFYL
jgi:hypothetical protein